MTSIKSAPRFAAAEIREIAKSLYDLAAHVEPLPSERDQNFLLTTDDGVGYVLKISNALDDQSLLEAQNSAMEHVAQVAPICPRPIPNRFGEWMHPFTNGQTQHFVRLVTFLKGTTLAQYSRRNEQLLVQLGQRVGQINQRLSTYNHPALHRDISWNLAQAPDVVRRWLHLVDNETREQVEFLLDRFETHTVPMLSGLRTSVIHNDANDGNVVIDDTHPLSPKVVGLIDFGDMVHSYTIGDLAIAVAYGILNLKYVSPLQASADIVEGFHTTSPITETDVTALFGLVGMRLCVSICMAAHQHRERPDDPYLTVSQEPIREILPWICRTNQQLVESLFRRTCGLPQRRNWQSIPDWSVQQLDEAVTMVGQQASVRTSSSDTLARRNSLIGKSVRPSYRQPLKIVRGKMQYLFDERGQQYLDAYNNVPHVGHCHPEIVRVATQQMATLNTNTRYLHDSINEFAEKLCRTLPDPLEVCFFVNSATEANELALRLARNFTQAKEMIVLEAAYHGHSSSMIDLSPYKHDGPGGGGAPDWVHTLPIPDVYRGNFKTDDPLAGRKYAKSAQAKISDLAEQGKSLCAFLAETCPSVGGQIMLPARYLNEVYAFVRDAGGVCIADEVQTGYGRIGTHFYAFQAHDVVPDIVVLGKPIGNGHPIGALVTTREIADAFDTGMEFFSTFGGNTVSSAIGTAVLEVVQSEDLQQHALSVGKYLLEHLQRLKADHPIIGDVRGSGFFLGVELVRDQTSLAPATTEASNIVNRLREKRILLGTDGPHHNVIKIRPPMPFDRQDAELLADSLAQVLTEFGF